MDTGTVLLERLIEPPIDRGAFCRLHPYAFLRPRRPRLEVVPPPGSVAGLGWVALVRARHAESPWAPVRVGRDPSSDVVIADARVSRHHATFERDAVTGGYLVLDTGSRNGVRVDGVRVPRRQVAAVPFGARVAFGGAEYRFLSAGDVWDLARAARAPRLPAMPGGEP